MSRAATPDQIKAAPVLGPRRYLELSELPLTSLIFVLPAIIVYELGTGLLAPDSADGQPLQISAFLKLQEFFRLFGANGRHLPPLAVIGVLIAWHIARRDSWQIHFKTLLGMCLESAALVVPLVVAGRMMARYFPVAAVSNSQADGVILSLGAGVYEEFVFRLGLITLLSLILRDVFKIERLRAYLLIVVLSSIAFSLYHYWGTTEQFQWQSFAFRTIAGGYFAALFLLRGFGITAGSHAFYDILITLSCSKIAG